MHAGRLNLAHRAISRAAEITARGVVWTADDAKRTVAYLLGSSEAARQWIDHTETVSTLSVIATRLGRPADQVLDLISRDAALARHLVMLALEEDASDLRQATELLRAARRLIARLSHISLLKGSIDEALENFRLATRLEGILGRPLLTGDAGRRYIQSLVRSGASDAAIVGEAGELSERILSLSGAMDGSRKQQSNEIIPLLTTKTMIQRLRREFDAAFTTREATMTHKFVLTGECTYAARVELELERARLYIAAGCANQTRTQSLRDLQRKLHDSHHLLYAIECGSLLAEALPPPDRGETLRASEIIARSTGWLLRCEDIAEIRREGSALKRFGC
jgi:hypothetical protein